MDIKLHFLRIKHVHDTQGFSSMQPLQSSRQSYTMAHIALNIISIDTHGKTTLFKQILKGGKFDPGLKALDARLIKKAPQVHAGLFYYRL
jgi:hypothetical protein